MDDAREGEMKELTPQEQERIRQAVLADKDFMAGVRAGVKAYREGRITPWSQVKRELNIK